MPETTLASALCMHCLQKRERNVPLIARTVGAFMRLACPVCGHVVSLNENLSRWMAVATPYHREKYGA